METPASQAGTVGRETTYASSGVSIDEGNAAVAMMKAAVRATYTPDVLAGIGSFGGVLNVTSLKQLQAPALVASTDGVGTKTKVAAALGRWDTIGQDLVNHCVNDILVQGATPLLFMDYVATSRLDAAQVATVVSGVAKACREAGMPLLGGETAEMPDVYRDGEMDVAGTIIGVVDGPDLIDGRRIEAGDIVLGLPSTGLHTNGYSLARQCLAGVDLRALEPELGGSIGDALLAIHRSYLGPIRRLMARGVDIRGMAHVTGGGIVENLPRILRPGLGAMVELGAWPVPALFGLIQRRGRVPEAEMYRAFNMGLGMLAVIPAADAAKAFAALQGDVYQVGEITVGGPPVALRRINP